MTTPSCCEQPAITGAGPLELTLLFTTGVTISLGHCVGMCGPIVSAYSVALRRREGRPPFFPPLLRYHSGRLVGYAIIGGALGTLGTMSRLMSSTAVVQAGVSLVAAALVLLVGLGLAGVLPARRWAESPGLGRRVSRWIGSLLRARTRGRQFLLGIANGFLPCGPVIAVAVAAAAAANPLRSMGAMLAYGLGTVPVLVVLGYGVHRLSARARLGFHRVGAALVLIMASQLALRGLAQLHLIAHLRIGEVVIW